MGAFMDRYNRMKGIGTVPDTVQAEGEDSSSVPASEVKPGAFTERYNKLLEARAADMRHSLSEWSAANDTLARSYGSYSVEELAKQTDALRTSGESLKQRIRDSGLYDDDTVTALGEGIDSWNRVHDIYRRDLDLAAGRAEREQATAELPASSLPVYGRSPVTAHNGRESTLEDKILYAQASVDMLESKLENSKGKTPSPEQLMSGDAGIDGNDEIKAALKEKKKELEQLLKKRQESEIAEWREENGLSDGTHVPSSPAQDVEAVLSAKSEYFNPDDNKDPYGNDLRPAVNTVNNIARAGDRVKEAGDLAMSAFSAGIDRSIAGIGDAARTAYETVKGTADRLAGLNQIPELKKYSPAAPEAEKSLTKRLEDAAVAGSRAVDNYLLSGDTYNDRSEKDTVMQDYLYRRENQTLGKAGNVIADLAENFGYQMPNMLLTHGFGLTGLSSNAATAIMFGSPAYVSNRRELLEEGYSSAEADLYGKAGFLIEGVGESLLGDAFGTVPVIGRKLGFSMTENISNPMVRGLMVFIAEAGEEGLEEVAQSFLEAWAKSAITGEDFELDAREVAYEGALGTLSGAILGSFGLKQRLRAAGQVHAADVDYVNTLSVNAESIGTAAEAEGMIAALEKQRAALSKMTDETTGVEDTARRVKYLDTALEALSETLKEKFSLAAEITPQGGYEVKDKRNPIERAKDSLTADARSAGSVELALEAASRATDADSAAEAIAALEMQRQRISELGRTGFTARYEDRKMLEAEMKLRDRFGIEGTYFGASVDGKYTPEADGARYSIEQTDRGKPVVVIDTDILNGVSDADKKNAVRKFISQNYPNGIRVRNGVIEVTGKTGKEYTRSGYSQYIEKNDAQVYDDKLRAAGNLDEAVRASTDYVNEEIKHPRKDNIKEFARGRVLMRVGQNDYNAEVVVGYTKNGKMLLYDIVNFKPDTFSVKERTSRQPGRGEAGMTGDYGKSSKVEGPIKSGPATTDNSISQNNAAVNSQYTQESENDAADTAENGADTAENGADEGDFAVDREGSEASAAFGDEALDREGYTPTEQTRVVAMNEATRTGREYGASPAQQAAAEELSRILDRRVLFFRSDDPTVNGYYKNGTIHVNAASGRTVASIIASEMTHAIETTSDYGALRELALRELSREKGMSLDELRAQKKETYAAHGENLDADGVDFELCEEYVGRYLFGDVAQIRAAVDYKPSLGRKIIAFLDEIIRRLTGRVRAVSSRILKDAQYARELWGRAVREAKARGASGRSEYTAEQRKNTRPDIDRSDVVFANDGVSYSIEDSDYEKPITPRDVEAVQSIGRKSINAFTSEEIRKTQKWAHKFYRELGTKSPFFRAWFGDWRAHDNSKTNIVSVPTIDISQAVLEKGDYYISDTGWTVYAGKTLNDDTRHHSGGNRINVKSLNVINTILDNAILLDTVVSEPNTNKKSANTAFLHKLYTPITYDGKPYIAVSTVEEYYNETSSGVSRRAYNLKAIKTEPAGGQLGNNSSSSVPVTDSTISISDLYSLVKTYDKDFTAAHDVSPELLNEDGTPKVFYHGTGANFTVFKSENGTYWFSESIDYAEAMAYERAGKNGRVGAFYLDMKNPYRAKLPPGQFTDPGYENPIIEKAKSGGYDGVIIENDTDSDIEAETFYVVFSPNQIKSATDNIGTFDRGNDDTRYSIEDSGWDAYHRRNQEELESNTSAAERARREERAEERAAAEEEARDRLDTLANGGTVEDRLFDSAKSERGNIERENMKAREATMTQEEYERIIGKPLTEEEAADLREEISKAAGSIAAEEDLYSAAEEERLFLEEERTTVAPKWFEQVKKSGSLADEITAENKRRNSKLGKYIREHGADTPDVSASDFAEAAVKEVYGDSLSDEDADRQKKRIETEAEAVRDAEKAYAADEAEGKRMSDGYAESTKEERSGDDGENVRLHPKNPDPNSKSGRKQLREAAQATYAEILKRLKPTEAEIAFAEKLASGEQYAANIPDDMNARRVEAVTAALRAIRYYSGAKDGGGALQRLGVKIESPLVSNYSDAAYLRGWEDARRNSKEAIYEAVAKYQISKKEGVIARSVADGILDIDEVKLHSNFARFKVAHLADLYRTADIYAANAITAQRSRTAAKFQPSLDAILGGMDGERLNKRSQARLNLNTMVRNNLAVFGEVKGAQINSLLFRPIQLNEAERMRFVNEHVEEFTNNYGKVTKTESALVQMLMEGRLDTALLQSGISKAKKDARRRFDLNGTQIETAETEVAAKQALEAEKKNLKKLNEQIDELKTKRDSMILRKIDGDISEVEKSITEAEKEVENSKALLDLYGELEKLAARKKSELEKDSKSEGAERAKTLKKIDGDISEVEKKISEAEEDIKSEKTLLGLKGELRSLEDWKKSVLEKNPKSSAERAEAVREIDDKLRKTEEAIARTEKKAKKKEHDIEIERAVKKQYLRLLELRNERVKIDSEIAAYEAMKDEKIDVRRISSIANYLRGKYAEFYEATNDFLVTHGYSPIGFIKNYAPHMQPEQMTKLSEALHALGVSPDLVKAFDASLKRLGIGEDVSSLPVEIAGRTGDFKPGKKWNPHYLTRTGERTEFDALAGYNGYVSLASEVFYHTDDIQKLRQFNQTLRTMYSGSEVKNSVAALHEKMRSGALSFEEGNAKIESKLENVRDNALSPYVTVLENYTNVIAGKQTMGDRASEAEFGRAALSTSGKIRGVFARAAITGNVSSALAQVVQLPMVVSECGNGNLMRAIWDVATRNLNKKTDFDSRSVFITGKRGTNRVAAELAGAEKVADIAVNKVGMFLFETVDDVASRLIVRTKYLQLIRAGVGSDAALALADEYADSVVGSRMKGAKPMMFCNKSFVKGLFTMFQLEVANSWAHIDQDIPADIRKMSRTKGKNAAIKYTAAVIVKYLLGAFFLDRLADELYGQTPVQFDVLGYVAESLAAGSGMSTNTYLRTMLDNAFEKLFKARPFNTEVPEKDRKFDGYSAVSALAEGILGDVPAAQNILGMLGMSETKFPLPRIWSDSASSALEKITSGDADVAAKGWRQFGSAALSNVATWFPFGNQLNKSIRGIYAIARKGSYDYSGRLQYPAGDSVFEKGAAVLFGKSAFNSNADFWAGGSRALSEEATEAYKLMLKYGMSQVEAYRLVKELSSQKADRAEKEEVDVSGMDGFDALAARYFTNDEAEGASGANDFDTLAAKYFGEGNEDEEAEDLSRRVINRQIEIINSDKYDLTDEQKYRVFSEVCASSKAADVMAALDESGAERGEIYRLISSIAATKNTDEEPRAVAHLIKESKLTGEQKAIAYYALAASKKERQVQKELDDLGENSADVWEMLDSCTELRKNEADEDRFEKARRVLRESEISKKGKAEAYYLLAASAKDREFMDKVGGDFDMGEIADTLSRLRDCGKQEEKAQALVDSSGLTVYEKRTVFLERVCTESNRAKKEEAIEKIEDAGGSAETYLKALSAVGKATYTKGETLGKSYAYKKAIDRVARGTRLRYALYEVFDVSKKVW